LRKYRTPAVGMQGEWKGLRRVPRDVWEEMLDIVKCKVLSVVEGEEIDAYLLRCDHFLDRFGTGRGTFQAGAGGELELIVLVLSANHRSSSPPTCSSSKRAELRSTSSDCIASSRLRGSTAA
jgi:hypothetical protein